MTKRLFCLILAGILALTLFGCKDGNTDPSGTQAQVGLPIEINKSTGGNPIGGFDDQGNLTYGGDPSVLVDGDTVYLYVGHDTSTDNNYVIPEYLCYSSKDLINWNYEGVVLKMTDVTWDKDNVSAWAGQVVKHYDAAAGKDKYYFYYCSWNNRDGGKQGIGVAVSESPTGPFVDIGDALVKGSFTTDHTSDWNDIDPTVWIETDSKGVEHRYLAWGNSKLYMCELNEDMISVKDYNGDGQITFGNKGDIRSQVVPSGFTEGPWLYRRQNENGEYYGEYYCFYASGWRERLAYSTADNLMDAMWFYGAPIMEPAATSNTSHCAVFDFNGKTYIIYHNGSLPKGSGYRRVACIAELNFNKDGGVEFITESATGIGGTISTITALNGEVLTHAHFENSGNDVDYPYDEIAVGSGLAGATAEDSYWEIVQGKEDSSNVYYVSIESYNKAGLYLTTLKDNVLLSQDYAGNYSDIQTFKTVTGLAGSGVSFESVANPGQYLTLVNGKATLTDGSDVNACSFNIATVE